MTKRILLAEDDDNLAFVIQDQLELAGYEVAHAKNGNKALSIFHQWGPALCLLDVMMPAKDGFQVAEEIRKHNDQIPILFLTARSMKEDRIAGFKKGGDDYITKPFSIEELLLRIAVFFRRAQAHLIPKELVAIGNYTFDYKNIVLERKGHKVQLTQKEADVLHYFCQHINQLVKREDMLKHVWGDDDYFMGRSLDVFIAKLRKYLADDPSVAIRTVHGVGFQLVIA